ncbi:MAG: transcriptional regulator NrdR [Legionellales bacterium]|nr:transcriptional regulator NrdR [Legionellales bacterium]|tara:strand:- start:590 stop:1057 length:468 start_codon:yes stop_codon:yes gene_type:complete
MFCPFCQAPDTRVIDSRLVADGSQVRRRRECIECKERLTTYEVAELLMPKIIKRNGTREPFYDEKLRAGMMRALEKCPITAEMFEVSILKIIQRLRSTGEREVSSKLLGEWVMAELQALDLIAYIRFASVYWDFKDIQTFKEFLDQLQLSPHSAD